MGGSVRQSSRDVLVRRPPLSEEMAAGDLGDHRLNARRDRVVEALERHPDIGFPEACGSDADTEALYRFLRNRRVSLEKVMQPHVEATVRRCQALRDVLVIHDSTENCFSGEKCRSGLAAQGPRRHSYWLHAALAASADAVRAPLGVLSLVPFVRHPDPTRVAKPHWRTRFRDPHKESRRWAAAVETVRQRLGPDVNPIHVMDREGDNYELFSALVEQGERFVIRLHYDRKLILENVAAAPTLTAARPARPLCECTVAVATRQVGKRPGPLVAKRPAHGERVARVNVAVAAVTLKRPRGYPTHWPRALAVNVVYAWEAEPPTGESPLEWQLVTTEPIDTVEHVLGVVEWYRRRWLIEEFFKCLKTGCAYEKRQLESLNTLLVALGLLAPIAWQLLLMRHLARDLPTARASVALTAQQIAVLRATPAGRTLPAMPCIRDALLAIARLGGHLRQNGAPGWLVLTRGMQTLRYMEAGWAVATTTSDQS